MLLEKLEDGEIASLAQIPEKVVSEIRRAKEDKNTGEINNASSFADEEKREITNLVALDVPIGEIARKMNCKIETIKNMKFLLGLYSRIQIVNLSYKYKGDVTIARITGVDAEIVQQIREERRKRKDYSK